MVPGSINTCELLIKGIYIEKRCLYSFVLITKGGAPLESMWDDLGVLGFAEVCIPCTQIFGRSY